jgi:predicted nucleic acid-binding protein
MANLTITVDEGTMKQARMRALEEDTSVNAVLREYLEEYAGGRREQREAARRIIEDARRGGCRIRAWRACLEAGGHLRGEAWAVSQEVSRSFFDTDVLLYMYDDDEPNKKASAIDVFERAVEEDLAVLSTQVLQEFYVNATSRLAGPLSPERAAARVRDFVRLPLVRVDETMIIAAIERHRSMYLSFWDALIVEAALRGGADRILTEDLQHGQRIEDLAVENLLLEP